MKVTCSNMVNCEESISEKKTHKMKNNEEKDVVHLLKANEDVSEDNKEIQAKKAPKKKGKVKVFTKKKKKNDPEDVIIKNLQEKYTSINTDEVKTFADFPLSQKTLKGLKESGYTKPTEIQRDSISFSLQGKDILGAAKTGSGKTLAFVIPVLEVLYCNQWTRMDGCGALIITPTRELAYQIFETFRAVGRHHDFSAGLIIGGKDLKFEKNRMDQCNIIICTPGRLHQHMDENPLLNCDNVQILVLDEADRCLDMGFKQTMDDIIAFLPLKRQTLLFSATQTKSVKDLARLSLKDPSYVSVHEHAKHSTPTGLEQSYVVCKLEDKLSIIWSFIKNHSKQKVIIFFATCKQVKYFYEIFCKLRPGVSLMALYGTLHQLRRMKLYEDFCKKQSAVLFATDLVARGLDFPEVHWVVQADCPEDADTYIHRVGRTARYFRGGESLLLLMPSELAMLEQLEIKKIPINKIEIHPSKIHNPVAKIKCFLFNEDLKDTAKRAFMHYIKSVCLMKDKDVFKIGELDTDAYALSLGLTVAPQLRFFERQMILKARAAKNSNISNPNKKRFDDEDSDNKDNQNIESEEVPQVNKAQFKTLKVNDAEDEALFGESRLPSQLTIQSNKIIFEENIQLMPPVPVGKPKIITRVAQVKKLLKRNKQLNTRIIFEDNEDGEEEKDDSKEKENSAGGLDFGNFMEELAKDITADKQIAQAKVKQKHKEEKKKLKQKKKAEQEEQDEFGTDSEGDEPDLSWLPDPDKVYGNKDNEDQNKEQNEEDKLELELKPKIKKKSQKRKLEVNEEDTVNVKVERKKQKLKEASATLSVNAAEELALMLLRK